MLNPLSLKFMLRMAARNSKGWGHRAAAGLGLGLGFGLGLGSSL